MKPCKLERGRVAGESAPRRSGGGLGARGTVLRRLMACGLAMTPLLAAADLGPAVTIASGLDNPRGIAFAPNGELYVAEAGRGGPGPCVPSPVQPVDRCYGETGAIARILPGGGFERIVTGLPSLALPDGTVEGGLTDLAFLGTAGYAVMGLAGDPDAVRAALAAGSAARARLLGTMLHFTPGGSYQIVADVSAHEAAFNPAAGTVDSNPNGLAPLPGRRIVADAGANAILEVRPNGKLRTFAVPAVGLQTVPTSVVEGPDGAIYAGLLTGFPFFQGAAQVLRIESDGSGISTYAAGFTAIVDIAFDAGGALYVLEIARGQVPPFPPPSPGLGAGRLKRQCPGGAPEVLLDGLTFAAGVAIGPDDAAYLTHFGDAIGIGEVLRLPLAPCQP